MNKEEKELQIKIAQLQTEIQIRLTLAVAFLAVVATSVIAEWQVIASPPTEPWWFKGVVIAIFFIIMVMFGILAAKSAKKLDSFKNELDNLR